MLVYIFVNSIIITSIILKIKENIIIEFRVIASIAIIIALGLIIGIAIIIIIIMRCLLRLCFLISLFSCAKRVFASFAL